MKSNTLSLAALVLSVTSLSAQAHVSFVADNAYAGSNYIATASVPHGCGVEGGANLDTIQVDIDIPAGFTSVRPIDSTFGPATVTRDESGNVTRLTWIKSSAALAEDDHVYQFAFRGRLPNTPITELVFTTTQTCPGGATKVWADADAPKLRVLPTRKPGWNKYTAQAAIDENTLKAFFADAEIVWVNDQAYSSNPVTQSLITNPLTTIPLGAEFWVKY